MHLGFRAEGEEVFKWLLVLVRVYSAILNWPLRKLCSGYITFSIQTMICLTASDIISNTNISLVNPPPPPIFISWEKPKQGNIFKDSMSEGIFFFGRGEWKRSEGEEKKCSFLV